jgi:alpha-tubulin suppressor-like RCC1 family protein
MEGLAVFTFGRGEDGQLGLGDTCDSDEPKFVDALRGVGVRQIACGSGHTVVLTTDGEVYTWGALGAQEGAILNGIMKYWQRVHIPFSLCLSILGRGDDGRLGMCSRGFSLGDEFLLP